MWLHRPSSGFTRPLFLLRQATLKLNILRIKNQYPGELHSVEPQLHELLAFYLEG
jgi:hypothetical protein